MINVKKPYMSELEKERIKNYVADMTMDELEYLVGQIDSEIMRDELARRDKLKTLKLTAISGILKIE